MVPKGGEPLKHAYDLRNGARIMAQPASKDLEALRQELHRANEEFHRSREDWQHWISASEYRHDERFDAARDKLRDAERKVEEVEERIKRALAGG